MSFRPAAGDTALRRLARRILPLGLRRRALRMAGMPARSPTLELTILRDDVEDRLGRAQELLDTLELHGRIQATTAWIELAPPAEDVLVSVITATRNRRTPLEQALASVRAQSYPNWEHIVIDDGSDDGTAQLLAGVADGRCRSLRREHGGLGSARNAGLDAASGSIIVYLDDDNLMHPHWLRAVVWAFTRLAAVEFLYGARTVEDWSARAGAPSGEMPRCEFVPYDRSRHEHANIIDANVMAHRAGIAEARFAEDMQGVEDWDLGLRLAARRTPLALPAIACMYRTLGENRLCDTDTLRESYRRLRSRAHTRRALRVLVVGVATAPAQQELLRGDLRALGAAGAELVLQLVTGRLEPPPPGVPVVSDLRAAARALEPDIVLLEWAPGLNGPNRPGLQLPELPLAVRVAAGADPPPGAAESGLCIGVAGPSIPAADLAAALSRWLEEYRFEHPG